MQLTRGSILLGRNIDQFRTDPQPTPLNDMLDAQACHLLGQAQRCRAAADIADDVSVVDGLRMCASAYEMEAERLLTFGLSGRFQDQAGYRASFALSSCNVTMRPCSDHW